MKLMTIRGSHLKNLCVAVFAILALSFTSPVQAQIDFSDDFQSYTYPPDAMLLGGDWLVGANVWAPPGSNGGAYVGGYFSFPAGNGTGAFSSTESDDGGTNIVLNTFSDYNNGVEHGAGNFVQAHIFQEAPLGPSDLGGQYMFTFDHQLSPVATPDINDPLINELVAFLKVLDPNAGFATVYYDTYDTSGPTMWTTSSMSVTIDPAWDGMILQWGFINEVTSFRPSGVWYDNVSLTYIPPTVPTMGEWGLICLGIVLMTFCIVTIRSMETSRVEFAVSK